MMMDTDDLDQELSKECDEESEAKGDSRRGRVMMRETFTEPALINLIGQQAPQQKTAALPNVPTLSAMQLSNNLQIIYFFTCR